MRHFDRSHWVDLVRGLASREDRAEMEAHLASGCDRCRRIQEIMRDVTALASAEAAYDVPQYAVHSARSIFALQQPEKIYFFPRIVGRLIYDSFKEPLPAGLRARHRLTRHALYEAADYSLDLRMEHQVGTSSVSLVGQIAGQKTEHGPVSNLPVFLVSGREVVARALSNSYGEFQFDYEPHRHLRLYLQTCESRRRRIEIPISRLSRGVPIPKSGRGRKRKGN